MERRSYYATSDGLSYSQISKIMTQKGETMNTATAREHFLKGLAKIFQAVSSHYGEEISFAEAKRKVSDPKIQEMLQSILSDAM